MKIFLINFAFMLLFSSFSFASELKIIRTKPSGKDVPVQRQVVFTFNRPVVPLGRMERNTSEIPVTVTPKLNCEWRWIDRSNLACQLSEKDQLKPATAYKFVIHRGINAEDGKTIDKTFVHEFTTVRPDIKYVNFRSWKGPDHPVMQVTFNQPVSRSSIVRSLKLKSGGKPTSVKVTEDTEYRRNLRYVRPPGEKFFIDFGEQPRLQPDDHAKKHKGEEARRVWLIEPVKKLGLDTSVELELQPGLESALGALKGDKVAIKKSLQTFPEFQFLGVKCYSVDKKEVFIDANKPISGTACDPTSSIYLAFSSPVLLDEIKAHINFSPSLFEGKEDRDPWENRYSYSRLRYGHESGNKYETYLPGNIKAFQEFKIFGSPKDEFSRKLKKPIDFSFRTDHKPPHFSLSHEVTVLEQGISNDMPAYVTNINKYNLSYKTLKNMPSQLIKKDVPVKRIQDVSYAIPLEVSKMLGGETGLVFGQVGSTEVHEDRPREFLAQVTNYQVYAKIGHYNSLIWVTDMRDGKPVEDAEVLIYQDSYSQLKGPQKTLGKTKTNRQGIAKIAGIKKYDPNLSIFRRWYFSESDDRFVVRIRKGKEFAFLPLDSNFIVNTDHTAIKSNHGHIHAWGTTAQGIYRAGQKIQYKIYLKDQSNETFISPPNGPYELIVKDPQGKVVLQKKNVKFSEFGTFHGEIPTNENSPVGWYSFLIKIKGSSQTLEPMRVLVADFTPSPFKVASSLSGEEFSAKNTIKVSTFAELHSGGPYRDAETRVVGVFIPKYFSSNHPTLKSFNFNFNGVGNSHSFFEKKANVGKKGELYTDIKLPIFTDKYGLILIESSVRDDRGKYIATSSTAKYQGVNRYVGLKNTQWVYSKKNGMKIEAAVADGRGNPVAGSKVQLNLEYHQTKAIKVKGSGNAFLTKYESTWVKEEVCSKKVGTNPVACQFRPQNTGSYRVTAIVKDTQGRIHQSRIGAWVVGSGRVIWGDNDNGNLEIIPESDELKVGEKARFLVKNPYENATALITVERYGVLQSFVQKFTSGTPIVEIPVTKDLLPGFYLSVVVTSERVSGGKGFGKLDLGKPTSKIGYLRMDVKDPFKEMLITAKPQREIYKPGDEVTLEIIAKPRHTQKTSEPIELAVAVLDEAVFDLINSGEKNYDPYRGIYTLDGLDVLNYHTLTRLLGRQKFEKKGANQGGDGASDFNMRNVFKYLSYWNPSIRLKSSGKTKVTFRVPDNLTGWRILAMGTTPTDIMGLGQGSFKVNRKTEVRPAMPNQVTEGDTFTARFTVMNRTEKKRKVAVSVLVSEDVKGGKPLTKSLEVELEPYVRKNVDFVLQSGNISQNVDIAEGHIKFQVIAKDSVDKDGLVHVVPVKKRRSLLTSANYGSTTENSVAETLQIPNNIYPDVGEISVIASGSVIANADGAFKYMKNYPYLCWEQKLTKSVMASHYLKLKKYLDASLNWKDAKDLPQATLEMARSYQAPNGGMSYYLANDQYVSPYLSAYTALAFHWLRDAGYKVPTDVESRLQNYLLNLIRQNIFPTWFSAGMASTVRAAALAALAKSKKISSSDLNRYSSFLDEMSLFGRSQFLMAALEIENKDLAQLAIQKIMNASFQSGGKFGFNETLDDSYTRILSTPMRANCSILSGVVRAMEKNIEKGQIKDVPMRLVRTITQRRGSKAHFENTQENLFCMNGLVDYARVFERVEPSLSVAAKLSRQSLGSGSLKGYQARPVTLKAPISKSLIGQSETLTLERKGKGRMYHATYLKYAPLNEFSKSHNSGIDIRKEVSVEKNGKMVMLKEGDILKRGDIVRVDIFASMPVARNFVVIDDPVPGGLEPINSQLKTSSKVDADKGAFQAAGGSWYFKFRDWHHYGVHRWSFYHQELRHDSVQFYSDYLPPGNYHVSYSAQAIATGTFSMMPVHAEEMYDPDVFGKGVASKLVVRE